MTRTCLLAIVLMSFGVGAVRAEERYFTIVFGAQRGWLQPQNTHTFAVFVRAECAADGVRILDSVTVSWLPQSLRVRPYRLLPERGVNLDLPTTFAWAQNGGMGLAMWGPYEIPAWMFAEAQRQAARYESGRVYYKSIDLLYPRRTVNNCIHAVMNVAPPREPPVNIFIPGWGFTASRIVAGRLQRYSPSPGQTFPAVADALELRQVPIEQRAVRPSRLRLFAPRR